MIFLLSLLLLSISGICFDFPPLHNIYFRYSYRSSDGGVEVSDAPVDDGTSGGENASRNGNPVISITVGLEVRQKKQYARVPRHSRMRVLSLHTCNVVIEGRAGTKDYEGR